MAKKSKLSFDEIKENYLIEKKIILKRRSYIGQISKIKILGGWIKEKKISNIPLCKIRSKDIYNFSVYLAEIRDLDKSTCEKYKDFLNSLFSYGKKIGIIKKKPTKRFILPLKKRSLKPKYIPQDVIVDLLTDIKENDFQLFIGFMIQYCSAVRPGNEMINLKVEDFDFKNRTIKIGEVNAKTGKQRYADLTMELEKYLTEYGVKESEPNYYIFGKKRTLGATHISANNLPHRFNVFRDKHKIDKGVKFYSAKHTGATDLFNSLKLSLQQMQKHLGHERISSTEHYIIDHVGITNDVIKERFLSPIA